MSNTNSFTLSGLTLDEIIAGVLAIQAVRGGGTRDLTTVTVDYNTLDDDNLDDDDYDTDQINGVLGDFTVGETFTYYHSAKFYNVEDTLVTVTDVGDDFIRVQGEFTSYNEGSTKRRTLKVSAAELYSGDVALDNDGLSDADLPGITDDASPYNAAYDAPAAVTFDSPAVGNNYTYNSTKFSGTVEVIEVNDAFIRVRGYLTSKTDGTTKTRTLKVAAAELADGSVTLS
jgi:hypothetical protein